MALGEGLTDPSNRGIKAIAGQRFSPASKIKELLFALWDSCPCNRLLVPLNIVNVVIA